MCRIPVWLENWAPAKTSKRLGERSKFLYKVERLREDVCSKTGVFAGAQLPTLTLVARVEGDT